TSSTASCAFTTSRSWGWRTARWSASRPSSAGNTRRVAIPWRLLCHAVTFAVSRPLATRVGTSALIEHELVSAAGEYDGKSLAQAPQPTEEEAMNEAKRRRDLLAKATQSTGKEATDEMASAATERDAKRRRDVRAKTKHTG